MQKIYIIRHGECISKHLSDQDLVISDEKNVLCSSAYQSIEKLAIFLKNSAHSSFENMYCSPITRARQTAEIISKHLNKEVKIIDDLRERDFNFDLNKITLADSKALQQKAHLNPALRIENSESIIEHRIRVENWLNNLKIDKDIIIVSHGGTAEQLLASIMGKIEQQSNPYFFALDFAHYHVCSFFKHESGQTIYRIDGVNLAPN